MASKSKKSGSSRTATAAGGKTGMKKRSGKPAAKNRAAKSSRAKQVGKAAPKRSATRRGGKTRSGKTTSKARGSKASSTRRQSAKKMSPRPTRAATSRRTTVPDADLDFGVRADDQAGMRAASEKLRSEQLPPRAGSESREAGVGGRESGPGSYSGGDLDPEVIGLGEEADGIAQSGPEPDDQFNKL